MNVQTNTRRHWLAGCRWPGHRGSCPVHAGLVLTASDLAHQCRTFTRGLPLQITADLLGPQARESEAGAEGARGWAEQEVCWMDTGICQLIALHWSPIGVNAQ